MPTRAFRLHVSNIQNKMLHLWNFNKIWPFRKLISHQFFQTKSFATSNIVVRRNRKTSPGTWTTVHVFNCIQYLPVYEEVVLLYFYCLRLNLLYFSVSAKRPPFTLSKKIWNLRERKNYLLITFSDDVAYYLGFSFRFILLNSQEKLLRVRLF